MKKILKVALICIVSTVSAMATSDCDCFVDRVWVNNGLGVFISCPPSDVGKPSQYPYFGLPMDSPLADTFATMAQAVKMQNLRNNSLPVSLYIWYDETDTSGTAWGCGESDCRTPQGFIS